MFQSVLSPVFPRKFSLFFFLCRLAQCQKNKKFKREICRVNIVYARLVNKKQCLSTHQRVSKRPQKEMLEEKPSVYSFFFFIFLFFLLDEGSNNARPNRERPQVNHARTGLGLARLIVFIIVFCDVFFCFRLGTERVRAS